MRKIIEGHKYDSDTARLIGEWSNDCYVNDFWYCSEELYRTKSGLYFVHGIGGAQSKYAEHHADGWYGGEAITPVSEAEAHEWAEEHLTADEYEAEWGEPDDGESAKLGATVSQATYDAIRKAAARDGISMGKVIDAMAEACAESLSLAE
jgi:hypothetical protein